MIDIAFSRSPLLSGTSLDKSHREVAREVSVSSYQGKSDEMEEVGAGSVRSKRDALGKADLPLGR